VSYQCPVAQAAVDIPVFEESARTIHFGASPGH
jgi:hypothetical protein